MIFVARFEMRLRKMTVPIWALLILSSVLLSPNPGQVESSEQDDFTIAVRAFEDGLYDLSRQQLRLFLEKYTSSSRRGKAQLLLGEIAFQRKEYKQAQKEFQRFLTNYPNHGDAENALFRLARSYFLQGQYSAAAETYGQIPKRFPESKSGGTAYYWAGESLYLMKKYGEAQQEFSQALKNSTTNAYYEYSLFRRGLSYFENEQYPEAVTDLLEVTHLDFNEEIVAECYFLLLQSYFRSGNYEAFLNEASRSEKFIKPDKHSELLILSATAYLRAGRPKDGIAFLKKKLENNPVLINDKKLYPEILYLLGLSHLQDMQYENGVDYFTRLLFDFADAPQAEESLINLAYIHAQLGQVQEAETHYLLYLKRYPKGSMRFQVMVGLSSLYRHIQRFDEAIQYLKLALKHGDEAEKGDLWLSLADLYQAASRWDEALNTFEQIMTQYADQSEIVEKAFLQMGLTSYHMGNYDKAIMQFQTFILQYPNSKLINKSRYWLGETFFQVKDYRSALVAFEEYLRFTTEQVLIRQVEEKIAFAYFKEQQWEKALIYYQKLQKDLGSSPKGEQILFHIGRCYEYLSRYDEAIAGYGAFIDRYPASSLNYTVKLVLLQLLLRQGNGPRALAVLESVPLAEVSPEDIWLYSMLKGQTFELSGQNIAGERAYKGALTAASLPAEKAKTLFQLALNLIHQEKKAEAFEYFFTLIREHADTSEAQLSLRHFFRQATSESDQKQLRDFFELARQSKSTDVKLEATYLLGVHYAQIYEYDRALTAFEEVIQSGKPENVWYDRALIRAGLVSEARQDPEQALRFYQVLLAEGQTESLINLARQRLVRYDTDQEPTSSSDQIQDILESLPPEGEGP
ncbi:tetratricopeptide repeat protein [bacterium]|nr:tetratricopeptide repeat protein [bacterium]